MRVIVIFSRICSRIARIDFRNLQESSASGSQRWLAGNPPFTNRNFDGYPEIPLKHTSIQRNHHMIPFTSMTIHHLWIPYANHGAGIWIPTFALVQNHPNDARGRQMEEADKQMALLQAHRSWRQNSTQKWKHVERYGTNGDFMRFNDESPQLQIGLYSFMHLIMHIYIYLQSTLP